MSLFRLVRPRQWIKNLLVFAPIFFAGTFFNKDLFLDATITFISFCFVAGAVYIFNDICDVKADRIHTTKKNRPIASGKVSIKAAWLLLIIFVLAGFITAYTYLSSGVVTLLSLYVILNILYSYWFKHFPIIDILSVALFYLLRLGAGGLATNTPISSWLILCTIFSALFVIIAKRKAEFAHENKRAVMAHYTPAFIDHALTLVTGMLLLTYSIYTVLGHPGMQLFVYSNLFATMGVLRYMQIIYGDSFAKAEFPERLILSDKVLIASVLMWMLYIIFLFYY